MSHPHWPDDTPVLIGDLCRQVDRRRDDVWRITDLHEKNGTTYISGTLADPPPLTGARMANAQVDMLERIADHQTTGDHHP